MFSAAERSTIEPSRFEPSKNMDVYGMSAEYTLCPDGNGKNVMNDPQQDIFQRPRTRRFRLTHHQTQILKREFAVNPRPDEARRKHLAGQIPGLASRQIQVWFQNRRAKLKKSMGASQDMHVRSEWSAVGATDSFHQHPEIQPGQSLSHVQMRVEQPLLSATNFLESPMTQGSVYGSTRSTYVHVDTDVSRSNMLEYVPYANESSTPLGNFTHSSYGPDTHGAGLKSKQQPSWAPLMRLSSDQGRDLTINRSNLHQNSDSQEPSIMLHLGGNTAYSHPILQPSSQQLSAPTAWEPLPSHKYPAIATPQAHNRTSPSGHLLSGSQYPVALVQHPGQIHRYPHPYSSSQPLYQYPPTSNNACSEHTQHVSPSVNHGHGTLHQAALVQREQSSRYAPPNDTAKEHGYTYEVVSGINPTPYDFGHR